MTHPTRLLRIVGVTFVIAAMAGCSTETTTTTTTMPGGNAWTKPAWTRATSKNAPAYTACVTNALSQHGVRFDQGPVGAGYRVTVGAGDRPAATVGIAGTDEGATVTYAASRAGDYNDQVAAGCL